MAQEGIAAEDLGESLDEVSDDRIVARRGQRHTLGATPDRV